MPDLLETLLVSAGVTSAALAVAAFLGRSLVQNWLKKDMEAYRHELRKDETRHSLELDQAYELRETLSNFSGVLLIAASDLQDRLWHVCQRQAKSKDPVLNATDSDSPHYPAWPMTRQHYLSSTQYLFAQYFCWVQLIREKVRFLDFGDDARSSQFQYHVKKIERTLAETGFQALSSSRVSTDWPIFQLQQIELGDAMIVVRDGSRDCMTYHEFRQRYEALCSSTEALPGLERLLVGAMSGAKSNFCVTRLRLLVNALVELIQFLGEERKILPTDAAEPVAIPNFDQVEYERTWPKADQWLARTSAGEDL